MAFDSKRAPGYLGEDLRLGFELGGTYVPMTAGPQGFSVLDERRAATLRAWVEALVPGDDHWPSAGELPVAEYVDRCAARSPVLRRALRQAVDAVEAAVLADGGETLGELGPEARAALLRQVQESHGQHFELVLELAFEGYYRETRVQAVTEQRTGFRIDVPVTGMRLEPFDEQRLERVRSLPSSHRAAEAR